MEKPKKIKWNIKVFANILLIFSLIIFLSVISSAEINDTLHLNLQTTYSNGTIQSGTFTFAFNITENSNSTCLGPVVYNHSLTRATDSRGIVSIYLPTSGSGGGNLSGLDFDKQYYLCYYRDGVLKDVSQLARVPYSFRATQVNLSEITVDSNLDMTGFNVTASWFKGIYDWIVGVSSQNYFTFNGTQFDFNESQLNTTIESKISSGSVNNSDFLDGYDSNFFMPLNTSVYGNFDFNGGWTGGGFSISGGDIFAQTVYVYNITSLSVSNLNINGSLFPQEGFDNVFDIGSVSRRWRDLYLGGDSVINGSLDVNEGTLFVDSTKNRVGIGITSPQRKLHVNGDILSNATINATGDICIEGGACLSNVGSGGANITGGGTQNYLAKWFGSSVIGDSVIYDDGTNIGIGTTDPQNTLNVIGDINSTGLYYGDGSQLTGIPKISNGTTSGQIAYWNGSDWIPYPYAVFVAPENVFIGENAGSSITAGKGYNTVVGSNSGAALTSGEYNSFFGNYAGTAVTTGYQNVVVGEWAGPTMNTGYYNTIVGENSAISLTSGWGNTLLGYFGGRELTTGTNNVFLGIYTGRDVTTGDHNMFIGTESGVQATTGEYNLAMGSYAGYVLKEGNYNVLLGPWAGGGINGGNRSIMIGYYAGRQQSGTSDMLIIDNRNRGSAAAEATNAIIYGNMADNPSDQNLRLNANVNISQNLNVIGDGNFTGNLYADNFIGNGSQLTGISVTETDPFWKANWTADQYLKNDGDTATGNYNFDSGTLFVDSSDNRIGIGTASPEAKLHIYNSTAYKGIILGGAGYTGSVLSNEGVALILGHNQDGNRQLWITESDSVDNPARSAFRYIAGDKIAGIDAVTPIASGAIRLPVEIGTDTSNVAIGDHGIPQYNEDLPAKLSVYGGDGDAGLVIVQNPSANQNYFEIREYSGDMLGGTTKMVIDSSGNVGINTTSPGELLEVAGNINSTGGDICITGGNCLSNVSGGGGGLWDSSGSDIYYNDGSVGIGTASPGAELEVVGTFNATGNWYSAGTTIVTGNRVEADSLTQNDVDSSEIAADAVSDSELDGGFGWTLDTDLNIDSNTLVVSYDDDKVGIGTASPASKLSVGGVGSSDYAIYATSNNIAVYGDGATGVYGIDSGEGSYGMLGYGTYGVYGSGTSVGVYGTGTTGVRGSGTSYDFYAGSGNDNYFSGDVGIKDSSPDYTLDVAGTVGIDSTLTMTGSAANIALGSNYLSGDGGDEGIYVSSTGKVGIGTASPASKLSVGGDGSSDYAIYSSTSAYEGVHSVGYYTGVWGSGSSQDFTAATGKYYFGAAPPTANTETLCWDGDGASMITDCSSSIELKRDINDMTFDWDSYMQLRPITFFLKDPNATQDIQGGFVAEYVDEVMKDVHPELVDYKTDDTGLKEPYGVDYNAVTAMNTKAIQELREENEMLKSELCNRNNSYNWCS